MRSAWVPTLSIVFAGLMLAQQVPYWRSNLSGLPQHPSANTTTADILRFERDMRLAAPYLSRQQPADYEANRALVRRMAAYLAGLQLMAADPHMRAAVRNAEATFNSFALLPWLSGYGPGLSSSDPAAGSPAPQSPAPPVRPQPPFGLSAPSFTGLSPSDKALAESLAERYETDAARAAGLWQNAEVLRRSLAGQGMSLNANTATGILRMTSFLNSANDSLRQRDWEDAGVDLQRVEAETEKVSRVLGR